MKTHAIDITGLHCNALIGVYAHERKSPQPIRCDVHLKTCKRDSQLDTLASTVDYDAVIAVIQDQVAASSCRLIETLAHKIAAVLLARFALQSVVVRVHKSIPGLPVEALSVTVSHQKSDEPVATE